ncbi:MAG: hypothetical protein ACWGN2_11795 [Anaerolineales bacterium]
MSEQRNQVRMWLDRLHYIVSACTLALLMWLFSSVHQDGINNAVFTETLTNISHTITALDTRVTVLESIRIEIAKSHYTKPEVESLVDRSIRPLQKDINRIEESSRRVEQKVDKIYEVVKK